jgi:hypothetical protein
MLKYKILIKIIYAELRWYFVYLVTTSRRKRCCGCSLRSTLHAEFNTYNLYSSSSTLSYQKNTISKLGELAKTKCVFIKDFLFHSTQCTIHTAVSLCTVYRTYCSLTLHSVPYIYCSLTLHSVPYILQSHSTQCTVHTAVSLCTVYRTYSAVTLCIV